MTTVRVTKKKTKKDNESGARSLAPSPRETGHNALDNSRPAGHGGRSRRVDADRRVARDVTKDDDDAKKKYSEDFYVGFTEMFGDGSRNDDDENDDDDDENHRNSKVTRTTRGYFARVRTENGTDSIPEAWAVFCESRTRNDKGGKNDNEEKRRRLKCLEKVEKAWTTF